MVARLARSYAFKDQPGLRENHLANIFHICAHGETQIRVAAVLSPTRKLVERLPRDDARVWSKKIERIIKSCLNPDEKSSVRERSRDYDEYQKKVLEKIRSGKASGGKQ